MKLKSKLLGWSTGRPVVLLNQVEAKHLNLHVNDRVLLRHNNIKLVAVVDIAAGLIGKEQIGISTEVGEFLGIKHNDFVDISLATQHSSVGIILKKLHNKPLAEKEFYDLMRDIANNTLSEAEIAYFVSAVSIFGLSFKEIIYLTKAIVASGRKLSFSGKKIADKHSIGGVSGRTTPIVVSICAAAGLTIPKTSSRAITTAAGTADAMETICQVNFSPDNIKRIVSKTGACLVWGGSLHLAPADDLIIRVERLLNLDPIPQLLASIMSKKVAISADYVLIDIPYGNGAKVSRSEAETLAAQFEKLGRNFNIDILPVLTKGDEPIGNGIGPVLEMIDVIDVLKSNSNSYKLREKSLLLAGRLLELSKVAKKDSGISMAENILNSGSAYKKFIGIIEAQNGKKSNIDALKPALNYRNIISKNNFVIKHLDNKKLNQIAITAGCPLDKASGIFLHQHKNDIVKKGDKLLTIYAESEHKLKDAAALYQELKPLQ